MQRKRLPMQSRRTTLAALVAVLMTVGCLWLANRAVAPRQASWDDVLAEATAGGYKILTTDELSERYRTDPQNLLLVDTRQEWEYRTGHLKGAVNFPIEPTWWSRWRKASALEALLGPDRDRLLIFY
jgi:hypothetical protein